MKILITGGPTREPIDAVRYISNRSSGKISLAMARVAAEAGHETTLLLGPVECQQELLAKEAEFKVHRFESSGQLHQLLDEHWPNNDLLIMAAAVSDYRVGANVAYGDKIPRRPGKKLTLTLEPTEDLVSLMASKKREGQRVVAFALETDELQEKSAEMKLKRKGVDAIVANNLATMGSDTIKPLWLTISGQREEPGQMAKEDFAKWLLRMVENI